MKPHIWFEPYFREWLCEDEYRHGWGKTPLLAYKNYRLNLQLHVPEDKP